MPIDYTIDLKNGLVRTNYRGIVTYREVAALAVKLSKDLLFHSGLNELVTFAIDCELQLTFMDFLAQSRVDPFSRTSKHALVICRRGALYGLARMFQTARNNNPNIMIIENEQNALRWLVNDADADS